MEIAEAPQAPFSERAVQDELERIRTQHFERGEYENATQACEALIEKFPESKWVGNAYLLAARCYHELGRADDEARTLESFLAAFPQHVQAVTVRKALEDLQRRYTQQVQDGGHPAALRDVEGRLQRLYEGLHDLKQRQVHLEELSRNVGSLADQVEELKAKAQLLAADLEGESGEPTVLELVNALIQDLRTEVDTQRKRTDARLVAINSSIEELAVRFKSSARVLWASVAAALVAFAILIGAMFQLQPSRPTQDQQKPAAQPAGVKVKIVPSDPPAKPADAKKPADTGKKVEPAATASPGPDKAEPAPAPKPSAPKPEPARVPPEPVNKTTQTYKVKPGDTLWAICSKVLGNAGAVKEVAAMNGLKAPDYSLRTGQVLRLPTPANSKGN